jgi:signal transduction histidine kinase
VIEDDGPGIPGSVRQQVLERGARLDPNIEGHGLGLAMVQETVRIYGGQIEIGTSPDGGASITIELPAEPRIQAEKTS